MSSFSSLPYYTDNFLGIEERLKEQVEDFQVEEIPAYEPCGTGEHLFLWIEKRDLPHDLMLRRLGQALGTSPDEIGTAGIKDRRAVSRQYVSVPMKCAARIDQIDSDELRVLRSEPHTNKLRTGHLRGNRFTLVVRETVPDAENRARNIAAVLENEGFPNYYGEQRFGHEGRTLTLGLDLLAGRQTPRDIPFSKRKFLLRLALSSVQSDLFNQTLEARLKEGLLRTVLDGDVMEIVESGGKFVVEDAAREQARLNAGEIAVTGPMFGVKMLTPVAAAGERETHILERSGLKLADFSQYANLLSGARRSYLVRPQQLIVKPVDAGIQFEFSLPTGCYATMLLREFMKIAESQPTLTAEATPESDDSA